MDVNGMSFLFQKLLTQYHRNIVEYRLKVFQRILNYLIVMEGEEGNYGRHSLILSERNDKVEMNRNTK